MLDTVCHSNLEPAPTFQNTFAVTSIFQKHFNFQVSISIKQCVGCTVQPQFKKLAFFASHILKTLQASQNPKKDDFQNAELSRRIKLMDVIYLYSMIHAQYSVTKSNLDITGKQRICQNNRKLSACYEIIIMNLVVPKCVDSEFKHHFLM